MNRHPYIDGTLNAALFFKLILLSPIPVEALPLNSYLDHAFSGSEDMRALDLDIVSLKSEIEARDLELSPLLSLELNRFWDDRQTLSSNPQTQGRSADLLLTKPFPTGTRLNLLSGLESQEFRNTPGEKAHLVGWEAGLSQSLWQNSFGRQTSYRRRRDQNELKSRLLLLIQERQETLIEFETLYWDLAYAHQEMRIRQENLDRSKRIWSYIKDRFGRSAAERTDLLQAQALVSSRELQLQMASDNLKSLEARLQEKLVLPAEFSPQEEELQLERSLNALFPQIDFAPATPVLIEALQARYEADSLQAQAKLDKDRLKPILEVGYAYGHRGVDPLFSRARRAAESQNNDYHEVGVVFATPLDFSLISKSRHAFESTAEAQKFRSARFERQSRIQWADLERNILEQKERVEIALELSKIQKSKGEEERSRYLKGRTTAFQAITFEQDAAEAELLVLQLLAQLRRTEAQARAYIRGAGDKP